MWGVGEVGTLFLRTLLDPLTSVLDKPRYTCFLKIFTITFNEGKKVKSQREREREIDR